MPLVSPQSCPDICLLTYMYVNMRTTLILDDSLFRQAKQTAAATGVTLSELTNSALRRFLLAPQNTPQVAAEKFSMPVFGEHVALHQTQAQLAEFRDEGR
jgi:hypothetical protein